MTQEVRYTRPYPKKNTSAIKTILSRAGLRLLFICLGVCVVGVVAGFATAVISTLETHWLVAFVVGAAGIAAVAVFADIKKLLLATILLNVPFRLDIFLNYQEELGTRGAVAGWIVSLTTIALVGLYVLWFIELATTRSSTTELRPVPDVRFIILPLLFIGFNILSVLVARDLLLSGFRIFQLLQLFMLFFYAANQVKTERDLELIIAMLLIGLILESLLMIVLRVTGTTYDLGFTIAAVEKGRVGGTMGSPNSAGGYLSMVLPIAICVLMMKSRPLLKWLAIPAIGLAVIGLIFTSSRGGWLAFAVACLVIGFVAWRQEWLTPSVLGGASVILVLLVVMSEGIVNRVVSSDKGAAAARVHLNQLAFNMIKHNPLLGVGTNNFVVAMSDYQTVELSDIWLFAVHNNYLLVCSEAGIGAFLTYGLFLILALRRGWTMATRNYPLLSPLALGLTAGLVGHMVHMMVDMFNRGPTVDLTWLYAGLLVALGSIASGKVARQGRAWRGNEAALGSGASS